MSYNNTSEKVIYELSRQVELNSKKDITVEVGNTTVHSFNGCYYVFLNETIIISGEDDGNGGLLWDFRFFNKCAINRINAFFDLYMHMNVLFTYIDGIAYQVVGNAVMEVMERRYYTAHELCVNTMYNSHVNCYNNIIR